MHNTHCSAAMLAAVILLLAAPLPAGALVYPSVTVTDAGDGDVADNVCTLREAIVAANTQSSYHGCVLSSPGTGSQTYIDFAIAGDATIAIGSALPEIETPVVVDGLSQPGADCTRWPPTLEVTLTNPSNGPYDALVLGPGSSGSTIRGLVINGFDNTSSNFNAAIGIYTAYNHVECNLIGTDASGTVAMPNLRGIDMDSSSPGGGNDTAHDNVIGSDGTPKPYFARNLITANQYGQVDTRGYAPYANRISGNYVGTDVTGTQSLTGGPLSDGIDIGGGNSPAHDNIVGWDGRGDPALMRNVISGITNSNFGGVTLEVGAYDNRIAGNYIGTDPSGTRAVPNFMGILIGSNANVYHNLVGNDGTQDAASARNVIAGNQFVGVALNGANGTYDNAVVGNYIGIGADGKPLGNGSYGISMNFGSVRTLVARNWIAGNPTAIRFFAIGGFADNSTATFLDNGSGAIADLPALASDANCVLAPTGVEEDPQGANVPQTTFANNWWGAATGPNTPGAASVDPAVTATPFLTSPPTVCTDVIFANGFDTP
ncbi:MAG TPA: CSLREA domain-containing protein [Rudaea sp.]|nr:CSLREA domain-containing protein [Rudaea sp.]